jgi:hypothetical protein
LPLLERVRVEVYIPDLPADAYHNLLQSFEDEFTYAFGGCTISSQPNACSGFAGERPLAEGAWGEPLKAGVRRVALGPQTTESGSEPRIDLSLVWQLQCWLLH